MTSIVLLFAVAIFVVSLVVLFRNPQNLTLGLRVLALGIMLADVVMLVPVLLGEDDIAIVPLYAMQMGSLDADYEGLISCCRKTGNGLYTSFFIVLCLLSPLVLGGFIASFFENLMFRLCYLLFSPWSDVCYFSELNASSLMLMKDILLHEKDILCVFCKCTDKYEALHKEAVKNGGILLDSPESSLCRKSKLRRLYFEISERQEKNVQDGIAILDSFAARNIRPVFGTVKVFIFSEKEEAELMLNSTDKQGIDVVLVNRYRIATYNLMLAHPLFLAVSDASQLSLLLIGSGNMGHELLKAFVWCSCLGSSISVRITVLDKDASRYRSFLQKECPEFFCSDYDIRFFDVDVTDSRFGEMLDSHCADADYIAVSLGDDSLNIRTAMYLRRHYIRKDAKSFSREPFIAVRVSDDFSNSLVPEFTAVNREKINAKGWTLSDSRSQNFNLHAFGANMEFCSYNSIVNSSVERYGLNCHAAYEQEFSGNTTSEKEIRISYSLSEVNRRSSRAGGMHLLYKLAMLGYEIKDASSATAEELEASKDLLAELEAKLDDAAVMDSLMETEHARWNAYMRSEGYCGASVQQAQVYKETAGSHRHLRAKLHACLCSWEELDGVCEIFDPKFKVYDGVFIHNAPAILGIVDDKSVNISKVHNILVRSNKNGKV